MSLTQKFIVVAGVFLICIGFMLEPSNENPKYFEQNSKQIQEINYKEKQCLISLLWHEARNQSELGLRAVMSVVENRKNHRDYPSSYCNIMQQPKQFSFMQNIKQIQPEPKASELYKYNLIEQIATEAVTSNFDPVLPSNVLHYTKTKVKKQWMKSKLEYARIQDHKFFITTKGI